MAVDYNALKVGDKVRYLGGDERDSNGELTVGEEYAIRGKDFAEDAYFSKNYEGIWYILDYNAHCFELVSDDDKSESACNCSCNHDSHIVSLAKEVAELKRKLSELKEYIEKEAVLFDERLIEVESKKP